LQQFLGFHTRFHLERFALRVFVLKPLNLPCDGATGPALRLPQHATRHMRDSKRSTDQAARQIVMFYEGAASA
jgi:hypothetical protein